MILLALALAATFEAPFDPWRSLADAPAQPVSPSIATVLAVPVPLEIARQRVDSRDLPAGLWNIPIVGRPGQTLTREQIQMAIAEWCAARKVAMPIFLTKEQIWPILTRKAGGRWKVIQKLIGYAGIGVGLVAFPPAAVASPVLELLGNRAGEHIPDISTLQAELPPTIIIPASGGITLTAWSAKIRNPQPIGPLEVK